jgi:DNA-binding IclR family transcriptional regulator
VRKLLNRPQRRIQSVGRAVDILFTIARARQPKSPSEIAALLHLERTTVHRLMVTLAASRLLRFDPATRKYRIGVGAFELGSAYLRGQLEDRVAERIMADLAAETRYTISLGALVDDAVIILLAQEPDEVLTVNVRPGERLAAHATAIGKLFLAERPDAEVRRFLDAVGMPRLTPNTITTAGGFLKELEAVRTQGVAFAREEATPGISSMGVPIRRADGELVAGLVVAPPAQFAAEETFNKLLPALRRAARRVESAGVVQLA